MDDKELLDRIAELVKGEHELETRHGADGLSEEEQARLAATEVALDQCWDLLRQRRARRASGQDPEGAHVRSERIVEGYQQ